MNLSEHFSFNELTHTDHADLLERNRREAERCLGSLQALCITLLEPLRAVVGPMLVLSGFRGPTLNAAVNGAATSQHVKGEAADVCPVGQHGEADVYAMFEAMRTALKDKHLRFGQIIFERKPRPDGTWSCWVHVSLGPAWRPMETSGQVLLAKVVDPKRAEYTLLEQVKLC